MAGRGKFAGKKGMAAVIRHKVASRKHKKFPAGFVRPQSEKQAEYASRADEAKQRFDAMEPVKDG